MSEIVSEQERIWACSDCAVCFPDWDDEMAEAFDKTCSYCKEGQLYKAKVVDPTLTVPKKLTFKQILAKERPTHSRVLAHVPDYTDDECANAVKKWIKQNIVTEGTNLIVLRKESLAELK